MNLIPVACFSVIRRISLAMLQEKLRMLLLAAAVLGSGWMVNADAQQPPPSGEPPKVEAPAPAASGPAAPAAAAATPPAPQVDKGDTAWILTSAALVLMMTIPGLFCFTVV